MSGAGGSLGVCGNIFRVLFVIFNFIYIVRITYHTHTHTQLTLSLQIFGIAALSIGVYSIVVSEGYDFITGNDLVSGAAISIVVGSVIFIVGAFGVLGAIFRWRPLLVIVSDVCVCVCGWVTILLVCYLLERCDYP